MLVGYHSLVNPVTFPLAKSHEMTVCYQVQLSQHLHSLSHEQKHYYFYLTLYLFKSIKLLIFDCR